MFVYDIQGQLIAEYTTPSPTTAGGTSYFTADHLGSTRVVTDSTGAIKARHDYLPFGEEIPSSIGGRTTTMGYGLNDGINQKFTSKERDAESGLDYFGARYFPGAQGAWSTPDRVNVTDDRLVTPSSTLNKYAYAAKNPLRFIDSDGRDVVVLLEPPHEILPGHIMLFANNPSNGQSAMMSFGPTDTSPASRAIEVLGGPLSSTATFAIPKTADELRQNYTALTVQTTPEQAQEVINFINRFSTTDNPYRLFQTNCATICRDALKAIGILPRDYGSISPIALWSTLYARFANPSLQRFSTTTRYGEQFQSLRIDSRQGVDYGSPRFGINTFDFIMLTLRQQQPRACVEIIDSATGTRSKHCD